MTVQSIGDQARTLAMQSASGRIRTTLATLTSELASGEVADLGSRLGGNTQALTGIEARLAMLGQYRSNADEAAARAEGVQGALTAIHAESERLGRSLYIEPEATTDGLMRARSAEAAAILELTIGRLNGAVGQQFLFSGVSSDTPPLVSANEILTELTALAGGLTSATDVAQAVSDWFDAPAGTGGYADFAYRGGGGGQATPIGESAAIALATTALSPSVRDNLKALATAALVERGALTTNPGEIRSLMKHAGKALLDNGPPLVAEMSRVGYAQQVIAGARTEGDAAVATLQTARNTLREADPFATSTAINDAETRLQSLFAVIGRLSQLKLANYL